MSDAAEADAMAAVKADLLAACEDVIEWIDVPDSLRAPKPGTVWDRLRVAIARARRES